jgi:ribulose 1,5-bisphosphate synthetase/thiazole synthase
MKNKLKELERKQDEATLEFWEAIVTRDEAKIKLTEADIHYTSSERRMITAKAAYLKAKLGKD